MRLVAIAAVFNCRVERTKFQVQVQLLGSEEAPTSAKAFWAARASGGEKYLLGCALVAEAEEQAAQVVVEDTPTPVKAEAAAVDCLEEGLDGLMDFMAVGGRPQ